MVSSLVSRSSTPVLSCALTPSRLYLVKSVIFPTLRRNPFTKRNFKRSNCTTLLLGQEYGNKQVVTVTPHLYDYILTNVREPRVRLSTFFDFHLFQFPPSLQFTCISDSKTTKRGNCVSGGKYDAGTINPFYLISSSDCEASSNSSVVA